MEEIKQRGNKEKEKKKEKKKKKEKERKETLPIGRQTSRLDTAPLQVVTLW